MFFLERIYLQTRRWQQGVNIKSHMFCCLSFLSCSWAQGAVVWRNVISLDLIRRDQGRSLGDLCTLNYRSRRSVEHVHHPGPLLKFANSKRHESIDVPTCMYICMYDMSIYLSIYLSIHLPIYLSIYLYNYIYIYIDFLSIFVSIYLFFSIYLCFLSI